MTSIVPARSGIDDVIAAIADSASRTMQDMTTPLKRFKQQEDGMEGIDSDSLSTSPAPSETHTGPPPPGAQYYSCNQCQKVFWSETSLKHHASLYHSEKAFVCEICNKAFRFRSNLAEHRSVHTALKPYVCKFCGKSSRLKGNLTKHILKHHKKEQNSYIGKDDIIIKKGKKSVKDPAAVDFLEKSMIVLTETPNGTPASTTASQQSKTTSSTASRSSSVSTTATTSRDTGKMNNSSAALQLYTIAQMAGAAMNNSASSSNSIATTLGAGLGLGKMSAQHTPQSCGGLEAGAQEMDDGVIGYSMDQKPMLSAGTHIPVEATPLFGNNSLILDEDDGDEDSFLSIKHELDPYDEASPSSEMDGRSDAGDVNSTPSSTRILNSQTINPQGGTRCKLCGKHFRKTQNLQLHMTLKHGHAPPGGNSAAARESPPSDSSPQLSSPPPLKVGNPFLPSPQTAANSAAPAASSSLISGSGSVLGSDLKELKDLLKELRSVSAATVTHSDITNNITHAEGLGDGRLENLLVTLDGRVARLEKQVDTSLSSLYTLVQLQSTMNTAFTRFRDEVTLQLTALQALRNGNISN